MAVFIELVTDPFDDIRAEQTERASRSRASTTGGKRVARRPLRGLEIKEDCPAAIKVVQADGTEIPLVDAGDPYGTGQTQSGYTNFILQSVSEARMEKHQIVETFGESYIFFFGEAPRFLDVQMLVINSHDFNWEAEWWENYDRFFRGTKLVEMGARLYMFYDDNIVEGYMLSSQGVKTSEQPFIVQMNFRMFLTGHRNITFVGDPQFPIRASAVLPDGVALTDPNAAAAIMSNLQGIARNEALAANLEDAAEVYRQVPPGLADRTNLTKFLRSVPRTVALPPDIVQSIESLGLTASDYVRNTSLSQMGELRGKIASNQDEYLGVIDEITASPDFQGGKLGLPPNQAPTVRSQEEVEDLWLTVVSLMNQYGAFVNSPQMFAALGLMPLFGGRVVGSVGGGASFGASFSAGFSASASAGVGASFTPRAGASFGTSLTTRAVASAGAGVSASVDPLGAVYGGGSVAQVISRTTVQGGGDREYGYASDFAPRPGFGRPGFGDYGGNGFGSGQGEAGDPGFRDPSLFTYEGVSESEAAFLRFNRPTRNNTVFTAGASAGVGARAGARGRIGLGASASGLAGGSAVRISGRPSCFSIVSAEGQLVFAESVF